MGRGV